MASKQKHEVTRQAFPPNAETTQWAVVIQGEIIASGRGSTEAQAASRAEELYRQKLYEGTGHTLSAKAAVLAPFLYAYHQSLSTGTYAGLEMPESQRAMWEARAASIIDASTAEPVRGR